MIPGLYGHYTSDSGSDTASLEFQHERKPQVLQKLKQCNVIIHIEETQQVDLEIVRWKITKTIGEERFAAGVRAMLAARGVNIVVNIMC